MRLYFKHQRLQPKINFKSSTNSKLSDLGFTELETPIKINDSHFKTLKLINNQEFIHFND
jgi:hypothetical protein